jgi:hypothetical protein
MPYNSHYLKNTLQNVKKSEMSKQIESRYADMNLSQFLQHTIKPKIP